MKKTNLLLILLLMSTFFVCAQQPVLKFNKDGKFKVIQITDTHFIQGNPASDVVPQLLKEVIDAEQPDLLVFTGDMMWQNKDTKEAIDELFAPVIERKIPWAYVFGNHDHEAEMSREEIMSYVTKMPYCLAVHGDKSLSGVGNYVLEVANKDSDKTEALFYCMDSHAYAQVKEIEGYAWFEYDQIDWYKKQSAAYTKQNDDKVLPALAFFHIPLPEYPEMTASKSELVGTKTEDECNGKLNTGMFSAMRLAGDVMGTFVGHDHDNDYIGNWHDIYLAYGRYSGGKTVYNNLGKNGCRVIKLEQGKREFSTYIRLLGGEKLYSVKYPETLKKEKKKK